MNELFLISAKPFEESNLFQKGQKLLSEQQRKELLSKRTEQQKRVFLCSRLLLSQKLALWGYTLDDCKKGVHGKPYIHRENANFYFNLSHTDDWVLLGISDRPIGVDIERVREQLPRHLFRILSKEECAFLDALAEKEKKNAFFRIWTMKESFVKYKGSRIFDGPAQISMIADGNYIKQKEAAFLRTYEFQNYMISICLEEEKEDAVLEEFAIKTLNINKLLNI